MIPPNTTLVRIVSWLAELLGLRFELDEQGLIDHLDENDLTEDLHFGRD